VRGVFSTNEKRRGDLRIGVSARVSILTYSNSQAIVIPTDAVEESADDRFIRILDKPTGVIRTVQVRTGVSVPAGIEIKSGLAGGETIVLR
jgi:hypothetical protein